VQLTAQNSEIFGVKKMASNQNGKRLEPIIGEDGRLYYNYGVGAKYVVEDNGEEYAFEIKDCRYSDTKVEYYKCTHNGEPYWNEFSANRLHHILNYGLHKTVSEGKRRELPLTVEEVQTYAYAKTTARAAAVQRLKSTDYFAKDKELRSIVIDKTFAEVRGQTDKLYELTERESKLRAKQAQILRSKKIDPEVLKELEFCSECGETGVKNNKVCACAIKLKKEIKEYNAILRRKAEAKK